MNQFVTAIRGVLVTAIYSKGLNVADRLVDNSAAVSLMSTDIERISISMPYIHDIWASVIELGVATYLLQRQVGVVVVVTIGLALCILP